MEDILNLNPLKNSFKEFYEIAEKRRLFFDNSQEIWGKSKEGEEYDLQTSVLTQTLETFKDLLTFLEDWNVNE